MLHAPVVYSHAVLHQRRRFIGAHIRKILGPCQAQFSDALLVHLLEWAEALLGVRAAICDPVRRSESAARKARVVHLRLGGIAASRYAKN